MTGACAPAVVSPVNNHTTSPRGRITLGWSARHIHHLTRHLSGNVRSVTDVLLAPSLQGLFARWYTNNNRPDKAALREQQTIKNLLRRHPNASGGSPSREPLKHSHSVGRESGILTLPIKTSFVGMVAASHALMKGITGKS